ncbi:hypothetical protein BSL78_16026 [Apostichopus japonicus]|uniref:EGF-like domain-containing protein n=1 Tax=Stichopus japonicus TaxID=307972 RepID=A0A2G8KGN1_STIJA|nr:hypothetical protein BSL78_16026 [Apostichopus japonicus]
MNGGIFYNKSWGVEGITDLPITWCSSNKDNYDNTCERTCENPNDCVRPDPAEPERCLCPENHMIFGDSCIPQEECGCYVQEEGVVLAEGEFYINSRCTRRSTCSNNQIIEASYQCSDHATCDERTVSVNVTAIKTTKERSDVHPQLLRCCQRSVLREGEFYINSRCTRRSTCSNNQIIEASYQCSDHATCDERSGVRKCYCNQNSRDGVTCTHNCFVAAKRSVLREGEFYINSRCTRRSTCSNNQIIEASYQCSDHATCDERSGVRKCYCNQNYQGDGVTCTHNCFVAAKRSVLREGEFYINSRCTRRSTCSNNQIIEASYQCSDHATCDERSGVRKCYCNQNYQGDGVTCTHNCFVAVKGSVLRGGESYINSDCSLRITCNSNVLTSESYSCSADATCEQRNDVRRCYCNEWFEGDGVTCTAVDREIVLIFTQRVEEIKENIPFIQPEAPGLKFFVKCLVGDGQ